MPPHRLTSLTRGRGSTQNIWRPDLYVALENGQVFAERIEGADVEKEGSNELRYCAPPIDAVWLPCNEHGMFRSASRFLKKRNWRRIDRLQEL